MDISLEEQAFLHRIQGQPEEDGPRLIYADWLDEQNDPRGEFIRIQCALPRLAHDDPRRLELQERERLLREDHESTWTEPIRAFATGWHFRRGLIEAISIDTDMFLKHGKELLKYAPIRRIRFLDANRCFGELMQCPLLAQVRELDLCSSFLGNGGPNLLSRCPYLDDLEVLDLGFNELTDRGIQTLAEMESFHNLQALHLNDNSQIAAVGVRALAESPFLTNLRRLDLSGNELNEGAIRALVNGSQLKQLSQLILYGNRIGDGGLAALVHSERLKRILADRPVLDLRNNRIGPIGMQALAASSMVTALEQLDLTGNAIGDMGLRALAFSPYLRKLQILNLQSNRITDSGILDLSRSPLIYSLEQLDLCGNLVSQTSVEAIHEAAVQIHWNKKIDIRTDEIQLQRATRRTLRRES